MALSTLEKTVLKEIYKLNSENEELINSILEGTEETRRALIVDYLTNTVKPNYEATLSALQNQYESINTKLTIIKNYLGV